MSKSVVVDDAALYDGDSTIRTGSKTCLIRMDGPIKNSGKPGTLQEIIPGAANTNSAVRPELC
jgi:hypothetical protein